MKKYLLTGGAGFIGSHTADALLSRGDSVIVLDDLSTGRRENFVQHLENPKYEFVQGSILDEDLLNKVASQADEILHFAAAVGVFNIVNNPLGSLATNIRGSENVLNAAAKLKKPAMMASTSEIYGKNTKDGLVESDDRILGEATKARWSYSEAKAIEEVMAYAYWKEFGVETRIIRFFNTVGPRQVGRYGMVVPRFVEAAMKNEDITVYGTGDQTRCFGHVQDIVRGVLAIIDSSNTVGEAINLGNRKEISIKGLAEKVIEMTESKSRITYIPYSEAYEEGFEDMQRRVPNAEKAKRLVGWEAELDLERIIGDVSADFAGRVKK
jgi:UDP-glucose 4-epimerase